MHERHMLCYLCSRWLGIEEIEFPPKTQDIDNWRTRDITTVGEILPSILFDASFIVQLPLSLPLSLSLFVLIIVWIKAGHFHFASIQLIAPLLSSYIAPGLHHSHSIIHNNPNL